MASNGLRGIDSMWTVVVVVDEMLRDVCSQCS